MEVITTDGWQRAFSALCILFISNGAESKETI